MTSFETSNTCFNRAGESLAWAPDGSAIAFLGTDEPKPEYSEIIVMDRLLTKGLTEFMDFRRTHLFIVSPEGGEPTQLTFGDFDEHSICWTPDSKEIVFISDRSEEADLFVRNDVWAVSRQTRVVRRITESLGADYRPLCSPDGERIAFLRNMRPNTSNDSVAEDAHLWIVQNDGENPRDLVKTLDRPVSSFAWATDGRKILFTASDRGMAPLYSVSITSGDISEISSGEKATASVASLSVSAVGKMAYLKDDPSHPAEVYVASTDGLDEIQVTNFNE